MYQKNHSVLVQIVGFYYFTAIVIHLMKCTVWRVWENISDQTEFNLLTNTL